MNASLPPVLRPITKPRSSQKLCRLLLVTDDYLDLTNMTRAMMRWRSRKCARARPAEVGVNLATTTSQNERTPRAVHA